MSHPREDPRVTMWQHYKADVRVNFGTAIRNLK